MTQAQKRGQLLGNRLQILNTYLMAEDAGSIADFFKKNNITGRDFFAGLPKGFVFEPAADREDIVSYTEALNDLYVRQYMIHTGEGVEEEEDQVDHNACGACEQEFNQRLMEKGIADPDNQYYAAGCGLPPIRPLRSRKRAPEKWAAYDKKKAAYEACRAAKKANKPGKGKRGLHAVNKYNPVMVAGRKAYFGLLRVNFANMAGNLGRILDYSQGGGKTAAAKQSTAHYQGLWKKVAAKWYNLGGDVDALKKNIKKGQGKKPLFKKKGADGMYSLTGVEETAAFLVAAAPVLAAITPVIKMLKKGEGEGDNGEIVDAPPGTPEITDDTGGEDPESPDADESFFVKYKTAILITVGVVVLIGGIATVVYFVRKKGK